jgi:hypothetical protein
MRRLASLLGTATLIAASATALGAQQPAASPAPPAAQTPAPPALLSYAGQLLDVERGFAFFTTGDGFRLAPDAKIVNAATGQPLAMPPRARMYATATFEEQTGQIVRLAVSQNPIPQSAAYDASAAYQAVKHFAIAQSPTTPNNDVRPNGYHGPPLTGRPVAVTFVVQVPVDTPLTDNVYITTDVSDWDPKAILMQRIDAMHYRTTTTFASGTLFHYKYDLGSFRSIEVGENGLDDPPRTFRVLESDALRRDDVVYHWKNESNGIPGGQTIGPGSVPTPYNPAGVLNLPTPPAPFGPAVAPSYPAGYGPTPPNNGQRHPK